MRTEANAVKPALFSPLAFWGIIQRMVVMLFGSIVGVRLIAGNMESPWGRVIVLYIAFFLLHAILTFWILKPIQFFPGGFPKIGYLSIFPAYVMAVVSIARVMVPAMLFPEMGWVLSVGVLLIVAFLGNLLGSNIGTSSGEES